MRSECADAEGCDQESDHGVDGHLEKDGQSDRQPDLEYSNDDAEIGSGDVGEKIGCAEEWLPDDDQHR